MKNAIATYLNEVMIVSMSLLLWDHLIVLTMYYNIDYHKDEILFLNCSIFSGLEVFLNNC